MKNKRIASIVLAMTLVLSTFSTVFATDLDIIEVDGTGRYGFTKWTIDSKLFSKITISPQKYFIEYGEENYELDKVMEKMNDGKSFEDAIADLEPVAEEPDELKVVSVSAINGSQIEVKFSAAVTEADVVDSSNSDAPKNVTVTAVGTGSTAVGILKASLSKDGKVLTVTNSSEFKGLYSVEVADDTITSKDNPAKKFKGLLTTIEIKDTVAPTVTGVTYDVTTATVKFSEPMSSVGTVSLNGVALTSGTDYTAFTAGKDELEILNLEPGKTYTLSIVGAKDIAGNFISSNPTTVTLSVPKDTVKPTVAISAKDTTITLKFSKEIDTSKGTLTINGGAPVNLSTLTQDAEDKTKYTYDASTVVTGSFLNATVKVADYEDKAGNKGDEVTAKVTLVQDKEAPKFVSATAKDDTITVKFDEKVKIATTGLTQAKIKYTDKDNLVVTKDTASVTATEVDKYGNSVTAGDDVYIALKVTEADFLEASKLKPGKYEVTIPAGAVEDTQANATTEPIKFTVEVAGAVETDAIVEVDATNTKQVEDSSSNAIPGAIQVKFNNEMGQSALDYRNYKLAGVTIPSASELYFDGAKDTVRINLPEGYITVSGERLLEVFNVTDKDGNTLKDDKNKAEIYLDENVRPVATKVEIKDDQTIVVTFSEKLAALPTAGVEGVKVKIGTVEVELDVTTPFALDTDNETKLTIKADAPNTFKLTDKVTVEFKSTNLKDLAGNTVKDCTVTN